MSLAISSAKFMTFTNFNYYAIIVIETTPHTFFMLKDLKLIFNPDDDDSLCESSFLLGFQVIRFSFNAWLTQLDPYDVCHPNYFWANLNNE